MASKIYTINHAGYTATVEIIVARYDVNDNLAIELLDVEDICIFCTITKNIVPLPFGFAAVDVNNCPFAQDFIVENGLGELIGMEVESGFVSYPIYKFNLDLLEEVAGEFAC